LRETESTEVEAAAAVLAAHRRLLGEEDFTRLLGEQLDEEAVTVC
jgi:hypothetical protein